MLLMCSCTQNKVLHFEFDWPNEMFGYSFSIIRACVQPCVTFLVRNVGAQFSLSPLPDTRFPPSPRQSSWKGSVFVAITIFIQVLCHTFAQLFLSIISINSHNISTFLWKRKPRISGQGNVCEAPQLLGDRGEDDSYTQSLWL